MVRRLFSGEAQADVGEVGKRMGCAACVSFYRHWTSSAFGLLRTCNAASSTMPTVCHKDKGNDDDGLDRGTPKQSSNGHAWHCFLPSPVAATALLRRVQRLQPSRRFMRLHAA